MIAKMVWHGLSTIKMFKFRSFLMGLGLSAGVAVMVAGNLLGKGAEQQLMQRVNQMFGPGTILLIGKSLKLSDFEKIERNMPQIVDWAPRYVVGEKEVAVREKSRRTAIYGHAENSDFVWNRGVIKGRFITKEDVSSAARVALIGSTLSSLLFADQDPIGQEFSIGNVPFEVVGVLADAGIDPHGEDLDENVFVPMTTAMKRVRKSDVFGSGKIVVSNYQNVGNDADEIIRLLRELHQLSLGQKDDFRIYTSEFAGQTTQQAFNTIRLYLNIAAGIILAIAAVVIASLMFVVVKERTAEIGIRKAIGAKENHITLQFITEIGLIAFISGLIGIIIGGVISATVAVVFQLPIEVNPVELIATLTIALLTGVISGYLPAKRAAKLDVVKALQ
ncbi:MAG: ABC transporter permease [Marinicella sp.]